MSKQDFIVTKFERNVLVPASSADLAFLDERYKIGTELKTRVSQGRSLKHHNLYWAVLRRVVEITGGAVWPNAEALDYAVKCHLRMFGTGIQLFNGTVRFEVQSIAWGSMDQGAFKLFFERAMSAIEEVSCIAMGQVIDDVKMNIGWGQRDEREMFGRLA